MIGSIPVAPSIDATERRPVAPAWHTAGLLVILALITYAGMRTHGTTTTAAPAPKLIQLYLTVMAAEWALVYYVRQGIRRRGMALRNLLGGTWKDASSIGRAAAVAVVFWFVWEGTARLMHLLLGSSNTGNVAAMLPHSAVQIVAWCVLSCTAGFCEEVVYRGYLQRQFAAWTGSASAAIAIQALLFGVSHGYQGAKQVVIISVLGALYGILAHWRRTLVPGMAAHAFSDIYGGWLHP